ncbi:MAG: hypothetical protein MRY63_02450 [Neomegalonema sp.]|nr:hypothetical protein [Neomegalonema sp.]
MGGFVGILGFGNRLDQTEAGAELLSMSHAFPLGSNAQVAPVGKRAYGEYFALLSREVGVGDGLANLDNVLICAFWGRLNNQRALRRLLEQSGAILRTPGSAELLLQGYRIWGRDIVTRLSGSFSFVLWDGFRREVHLARDPFGQENLLYHADGHKLVFGTHLRALLKDRQIVPEIDLDGVHEYLTFGAALGEQTLLSGVKRIKPGAMLTLGWDGHASEYRYAAPVGLGAERPSSSLRHLGRTLRESADASFRECWPIDAHIGALIDESAASALMVDRMRRLKNKPFPVFVPVDGIEDWEASPVEGVEFVNVEIGSQVIEAEATLRPWADQPIGCPDRAIRAWLAQAAAERCTHLFTPLGGAHMLSASRDTVDLFRQMLTGALPEGDDAPQFITPEYGPALRRDYLSALEAVMSEAQKLSGYGPALMDQLFRPAADRFGTALEKAPLDQMLKSLDWARLDLLVRGRDAALDGCIGHSAGVTFVNPFLTENFASAAAMIPSHALVQGRSEKMDAGALISFALGRRAPVLPQRSVSRVDRWARGRWRKMIEETLLDPSTLERGELQPGYLRMLVGQHMSGEADYGRLLFALTSLEHWRREIVELRYAQPRHSVHDVPLETPQLAPVDALDGGPVHA